MSRQVYQDGKLLEQWDDLTRTYTAYDAQGTVTGSRPYTAAENTTADATAAALLEVTNEATVRAETEAQLAKLDAEIIVKTNAELFTQSGVGSALKLLARTLRLIIRILIRRFDGTT